MNDFTAGRVISPRMAVTKKSRPRPPMTTRTATRRRAGAASAPTLTLRELNRATLARQMLLAREKTTPLDVIERLFGMQAQLPRPPFVGLWSRLAKVEREEVLRLFHDRAVVRATLMRVTIHLMTAKDYVRFRPALQPALTSGMRSALGVRAKGLDIDALVRAARAFFARRPATFHELRGAIATPGATLDERAMAYAVRTHLPLVQVPTDATWGFPGNADFALAESWLGDRYAPKVKAQSQEEATRELVRRYLAAFGPATVADAQAWSGHRGLAPVFEQLRPKLAVFRDEKGRELFDLPKAPRPDAEVEAPVRFLPEFDNVLLAHADRSRVLGAVPKSRIFLAAARALPAFTVDGMVAGAWRLETVKTRTTLVVEPFAALARSAQRPLAEEAERLARFLGEDTTTFDVRVANPSDR